MRVTKSNHSSAKTLRPTSGLAFSPHLVHDKFRSGERGSSCIWLITINETVALDVRLATA